MQASGIAAWAAAGLLLAALAPRARRRWQLSRAKHPSLAGHGRWARRIARFVPHYEYGDDEVFCCDGASAALADQRRSALRALAERLAERTAQTRSATSALEPAVSDLQFTRANRVPFQFRSLVARHLPVGTFANATDGNRLRDLDGNWAWDVGGSYGVNLLGHDWYKANLARASEIAGELGPVLGPYHPLTAENVRMIRDLSGMDEVSFHMSGTEAVMQAVRLARFNTRRRRLVMFCGAYHGWWDGVQAGVGHNRRYDDLLLLSDMSERSLDVLRHGRDIACVLINPLQALHPNAAASSDAMLVSAGRRANFDRDAYARWLATLRQVCDERGIALIFDEVFVGFRLGLGGAQEYFGVRADLVTYGKTVGGGLPIGVVAGKAGLMKRFREDRPADVCFARGTFNSHPYVMAAMNGFLVHVTAAGWAESAQEQLATWDERAAALNRRLESAALPVRVHNMASVWLLTYTQPGRYNWLLQYYLRAEGLSLSWVGTGRLIFSHDYTDQQFDAVADCVVRAAERMREGGWWTVPEGLTDAGIRRRVLRELLAARFGQRAVSSSPAASCSSASSP